MARPFGVFCSSEPTTLEMRCLPSKTPMRTEQMAGNIAESVPKVLKSLWDIENELRSAAQNGVVLRGDEARNHLQQARHHLDQLLGIIRSPEETSTDQSPGSTTPPTPTSNN
jgi:hypothetical protein